MEEINVFSSCTPRMIKCVVGINNYGNKIITIDKRNTTAIFPACGTNEDWEHVALCKNNKYKREEWEKELEKKLTKVE